MYKRAGLHTSKADEADEGIRENAHESPNLFPPFLRTGESENLKTFPAASVVASTTHYTRSNIL